MKVEGTAQDSLRANALATRYVINLVERESLMVDAVLEYMERTGVADVANELREVREGMEAWR